MAISAYVQEYTGTRVATLDRRGGVNALCAFVAADPARYPLLSGVDDHDDTLFNAKQCLRLARELAAVAEAHPEVRGAAEALLRLTGLMQPAPGRPHHRQLVFSGD